VRPREAGATNQTKQKASGANGTPPEAVSYERMNPRAAKGGGAVVRWTGMVADEKGGARTDFIADSCLKKQQQPSESRQTGNLTRAPSKRRISGRLEMETG